MVIWGKRNESEKSDKKQTLKHIFKNDWFLLSNIVKASPIKYFMNVFENIFARVSSVIFDVLLLRKIFQVVEHQGTISELVPWFIVVGIYGIFKDLYSGKYWWHICHREDQKITSYLNKMMYKKAASMDLECYENPKFYDKFVIATNQFYTRADAMVNTTNRFIASVFTFFSIIGIIGSICGSISTGSNVNIFTLLLFAIVPPLIGFPLDFVCQKISSNQQLNTQPVERKASYIQRVVYVAKYAKEIRLTNIFDVLNKSYKENNEKLAKLRIKYGAQWGLMNLSYNLIFWIPSAFVLPLIIAYGVSSGNGLDIAAIIPLLSAIKSLTWQIDGIVSNLAEFREHSILCDNILMFFEHESKIKFNDDGLHVPKDNMTIELKDVSFTYVGQEKPTLKNISLKITPNENIALVGINGAGKTTLIKLIMRLYEPTSGEVLLNGIDISKYNLREYYDAIGTVFQDFQIYSTTVAENVLLRECNTKEDEKLVEDSLDSCGVLDKIKSLKHGIYNYLTTETDKDGIALSGGENQKVAISRIFACGAKLCILDEPSSALDPIAEHEVYDSIKKASKDRGLIFISHRLSATSMADVIYLVEDGQILEHGSHEELMKLNGRYAEMFNKQAESYIRGVSSKEVAC